MTNAMKKLTNAELIKAIRDEDKGLGEHAMLSARIIHNNVVVMQAAYLEAKVGKGDDVAVAWIENLLIDSDNVPEEEYGGAGDLTNAHDPDLYFRDNHLDGELSPYQSRMAPLIDELERRIDALQKSLDEARNQKPVAFWWIGPDGKDSGGPYRGKPSDAAIDSARNMGCEPQLLFAGPVSVPAAPAPSVPDGDDFNGTTPHMIQCIEALVSMNDRGVIIPHGIGSHARTLLLASANRLRQQAAPSVPEEWREVMAGLVEIAEAKGKKQGSPNHCHSRPGIWDDDNIRNGLAGKPCSECALYDRARALVQYHGSASTPELNDGNSSESAPEVMIMMPREADEALVAGFVGCETREEAMLGWQVAVRIQDVRTGKHNPGDPVIFGEAEVTRLQKEVDEARDELEKARERLAERLKAIEPPFEVVNPACQACGDGTTSLCDHEDCPSGRFRGYDPMNRLIASDPKMKNPNCPREQIAKCVAGFCVKDVTGNPRCDSADDFIADAMSAPSPEIEEMTVAMAQEICAVSCSIGAYPQVLSAEVTRLQAQVEAARKMTLQIISVHVIADDIPGPSEKARRYYNRLAERFGVDRLEGSHENG